MRAEGVGPDGCWYARCKYCDYIGVYPEEVGIASTDGFVCVDVVACDARDEENERRQQAERDQGDEYELG
jgi:hypothetical protein